MDSIDFGRDLGSHHFTVKRRALAHKLKVACIAMPDPSDADAWKQILPDLLTYAETNQFAAARKLYDG